MPLGAALPEVPDILVQLHSDIAAVEAQAGDDASDTRPRGNAFVDACFDQHHDLIVLVCAFRLALPEQVPQAVEEGGGIVGGVGLGPGTFGHSIIP